MNLLCSKAHYSIDKKYNKVAQRLSLMAFNYISLLTVAIIDSVYNCLCMGDLQAPLAPPAPHFVFLITL